MASAELPQVDLSRSPIGIAVSTLSLLALILAIPPFISHVKGRNLAATSLIFWLNILNLFNFINPLIWPTDNIPTWFSGAGLCDLEVKISVAAGVGAPGAVACIFRQLAIILNTDRTALVPSTAQRRRKLAVEIFLCFAFPLWMMVAQFIVQPARFYVFAISGCVPAYDNSWLAIVLVFMWALILSILAGIYCALVIYRIWKYRQQFSEILSNASSSTNKNRFLRLFALSTVLLLVFLPLSAYVLSVNVGSGIGRYSWSADHGPEWDSVIQVPANGSVLFDRWIQIGTSLAVFVGFGFGKDATAMYKSWIVKCGLGRVEAYLDRPKTAKEGDLSGQTLKGSTLTSFSSRARLMFQRKRSSPDATFNSKSSRSDSFALDGLAKPSDGLAKAEKEDANAPPVHPKARFSHLSWTRWIPFRASKGQTPLVGDEEKALGQNGSAGVANGNIEAEKDLSQVDEKVGS